MTAQNNAKQPKAKSPKKAPRRTATKKSPRKRVAKKKTATNTAPYPAEYRQKVVALCLGLPFERVKQEIRDRALTVIPSTAWDWKRAYEKDGPEALIPKRTHVRDVANELGRLLDVTTANLQPRDKSKNDTVMVPVAPAVSTLSLPTTASASGSIDSIRKLLELHNEHPDVFDNRAVIALISRIAGV